MPNYLHAGGCLYGGVDGAGGALPDLLHLGVLPVGVTHGYDGPQPR